MRRDTNNAAWQQLAECVAQQLLESENQLKSCFLDEIKTLVDMGLKSQMDDILDQMIGFRQVEGVRMMLERGASLTDPINRKTVFDRARNIGDIRRIPDPIVSILENNVKGKLIIHLCVILETHMHVFKLD